MRRRLLGVCLVAGTVMAAAQEPAFEVATVKQNTSGERGGGISRLPGGRVRVTNMPLGQLITFAYQLTPFQLTGGPSWVGDDRFDIVARMEGNPEWEGPGSGRPDPIMLAMRALFADRFRLKLHAESRDMDVYALVMLKPGIPGPALTPSTTDCQTQAEQMRHGKRPATPPAPVNGIIPCNIRIGVGQILFDGFPMSQAASLMTRQAGRIVIDRTGLAGNWQFAMTFAPEQRGPLPGVDAPAPDPDAPSLFTAIQEQLGLKLESTKAPVDVTVIDAVEHLRDE